MKVIRDAAEIREYCAKAAGPIGLVPTMGAIHEGHLSLVRQARAESGTVVVSIFVNPLQFESQESSDYYPRTLEEDLRLLAEAQADVVFCPRTIEMYPQMFASGVSVSGPALPLEGEGRPGHFNGVTTIMAKLMNLVSPGVIFLGQKDFQQVAVIKRLVRDLNWSISIRVIPTVRDHQGLALSSRNVFLKPNERKAAGVIFRALMGTWNLYQGGKRDVGELEEECSKVLNSEPLIKYIEYVALVESQTFLRPKVVGVDSVLLVAVWIGETRLIDNIVLGDSGTATMDFK